MNRGIKEIQVNRTFFNNISDYKFLWHRTDFDIPEQFINDCFTIKESAYEYNWKLMLYRNKYGYKTLSLCLESCESQNAVNKMSVNLAIRLPKQRVHDLSFYKEFIDNCKPGHKITSVVPIGKPTWIFVVEISVIWRVSTNLEPHSIQVSIYAQLLNNNNKLSSDFEKLYIGQHATDVSFVFDNKKEIKAHKLILMARSPVFQAMFQSDMLESKENRVEIKDTDPEIFQKLIHYIYTGKMAVTPEDKVAGIMVEADKYALIEFKDYNCESEVIKLMNVENAADNLIMADCLNLDSLKAKAIEFILSKKQEILKTDGYKNLTKNHQYMHLMTELYEKS